MRTVAVIQARMESSRFPGKVMADICGKPMVERVIERVRAAGVADELVLCIPDTGANDVLRRVAKAGDCHLSFQYPMCDGSPKNDLLEAYLRAGLQCKADVVLRITADCPLICPDVIAQVDACWQGDLDYCSNVIERTWPRGLDTELINIWALEELCCLTTYKPDFEHVTLSMRRNKRTWDNKAWNTMNVVNAEDRSDLNWSVDSPEDLDRVRAIYQAMTDGLAPYPEVLMAAGVTYGA